MQHLQKTGGEDPSTVNQLFLAATTSPRAQPLQRLPPRRRPPTHPTKWRVTSIPLSLQLHLSIEIPTLSDCDLPHACPVTINCQQSLLRTGQQPYKSSPCLKPPNSNLHADARRVHSMGKIQVPATATTRADRRSLIHFATQDVIRPSSSAPSHLKKGCRARQSRSRKALARKMQPHRPRADEVSAGKLKTTSLSRLANRQRHANQHERNEVISTAPSKLAGGRHGQQKAIHRRRR